MINFPHVAIDTETTGLDAWHGDRMFAAAAAFPDGKRVFWYRDLTGLRELVEDPDVDKIFHNAIYDMRMLELAGFTVRGRIWDTTIFCHLLNGQAAGKGLRLENCAIRYLPAELRKVKGEIKEWYDGHDVPFKERGDFSKLPQDIVKRRCVGDANLTLRLFHRTYPTVSQAFPFLLQQEHALLHVVKKMEDRGVLILPAEIRRQIDEYEFMYDDVIEFCEGVTGNDYFNINSRVDQMALLNTCDLCGQVEDKTPTGQPKLNEFNLRQLHHPIAGMLLLGRFCGKMITSILHPLLSFQDEDNVLHASFNQTGTVTGRFSCSKPNLQNVPSEGERKTMWTKEEHEEWMSFTHHEFRPHVRRCFLVRPGYVHLHSDKGQAEVVMLAHYTKDPTLRKFIETGENIHAGLSMRLFGEATKSMKRRTKAVVFGYQYGAGLKTIARSTGTMKSAIDSRNRLARALPSLDRWKRALTRQLHDRGYIQTTHGRRHYIPQRDSYKCVNYMCQGSVGDEIKGRMVAVGDYLESEGLDARIVLNIHDDLAVETREEDIVRVGPELYRIMNETDCKFNVPLPADLGIAHDRWADIQSIKEPNDPRTYPPRPVRPRRRRITRVGG